MPQCPTNQSCGRINRLTGNTVIFNLYNCFSDTKPYSNISFSGSIDLKTDLNGTLMCYFCVFSIFFWNARETVEQFRENPSPFSYDHGIFSLEKRSKQRPGSVLAFGRRCCITYSMNSLVSVTTHNLCSSLFVVCNLYK